MSGKRHKVDYLWIKRAFLLAFIDIIVIGTAYFLALWMRFDFVFSLIPKMYLRAYIISMPFWILTSIIVFYVCSLYHSIWRFASISELLRIVAAFGTLIILYAAGIFVMHLRMPRSYYFIGYVLSFIGITAVRFSYRLLRLIKSNYPDEHGQNQKRIMIIGAGSAGRTLIREIGTSTHLHEKVCCIIDDNPNKKGRILEGVSIAGNRYDIPEMVKKYSVNKIILAIPTISAPEKRDILEISQRTGCELQSVPGLYQLMNGEVSISQLKGVDLEDLLGREPIKTNLNEVLGYVKDKVVLVTGGGGSIGSEICRQLASHEVGQLIILDMYENNAYSIQLELQTKYPELNLNVLIGSARNTNRIENIFRDYHPDIIFHAAAHKHVPLMENSPNEAIKNNVIGTYKTARAAHKHGVGKFILISTDKAVNPTNVMGASKRLCEMVIQMFDQRSKTEYAAVRFGNVLGSNGSVVPLFRKQIEYGGPVTVTHPDIIRYFMTIPEAVSLVLQAGAYAKGGEIFVLNMGAPVKILDMAVKMIRLSGYEPNTDIKIEFTGLRPGEKLYEELLIDEEGLADTENERIFVGKPREVDWEQFEVKLMELDEAAWNESEDIKAMVQEMVPEYQPQGTM